MLGAWLFYYFFLVVRAMRFGDIAVKESHSSRFGRKRARFHVVLSQQHYDAADQENIHSKEPLGLGV